MMHIPKNLENKFTIALNYIKDYFGEIVNITKLKGLSNYNFLIQYKNKKPELNITYVVLKIFNLNDITENSNSDITRELDHLNISPKTLYNSFPDYCITEYKHGLHPNNTYFENIENTKALSKILITLNNIDFHRYKNISNINFYKTNSILLSQVRNKYCLILKKILETVTKQIDLYSPTLGFCHNDLNNQNIIIDNNNKIWLIDFEYSGISDIFFDLASIRKLFNIHSYNRFLEYHRQTYLSKLEPKIFHNKLDSYIILSLLTEAIWFLYMSEQQLAQSDYYKNTFLKLFDTLLNYDNLI